MECGIVAIKKADRAKSRIARALGAEAGRRLARALAEDALDLIASVERLRWWVVSDDETVGRAALDRGLHLVVDPGTGFKDAAELGLAAATDAGATTAILLPGDLPLATAGDLEQVADVLETSDVVVVPSEGDGGTNALGLSPPDVMRPLFGPGSLQAHVKRAEELRLRCTVLALEGLALDIDSEEDIERFLATGRTGGRAYEICSELFSEGSDSRE